MASSKDCGPTRQALADLALAAAGTLVAASERLSGRVPPEEIQPEARRFVYARDRYRCAACGSSEKLTIDHIVPKSKGGPNWVWNLQVLCAQHNVQKGDLDPTDWLSAIGFVTFTEAQRRTGLGAKALRKRIRTDEVHAIKISGVWWVNPATL